MLDKGNLGVRVPKDVVDKILAIKAMTIAHEVSMALQQTANRLDQPGCMRRRDRNALQKIDEPAFPLTGFTDVL